MGGGQQQLQQLSQELQAIEEEVEELRAEIEAYELEKAEIDEAIEAIETLDGGDTVQVPLGGGAYVRAEVRSMDEIVVGLGGGYAAEQGKDGAADALEAKQGALDDRIEEARAEIEGLEDESAQLERQAQQMQQQMQQQQMQGMGEDTDR